MYNNISPAEYYNSVGRLFTAASLNNSWFTFSTLFRTDLCFHFYKSRIKANVSASGNFGLAANVYAYNNNNNMCTSGCKIITLITIKIKKKKKCWLLFYSPRAPRRIALHINMYNNKRTRFALMNLLKIIARSITRGRGPRTGRVCARNADRCGRTCLNSPPQDTRLVYRWCCGPYVISVRDG